MCLCVCVCVCMCVCVYFRGVTDGRRVRESVFFWVGEGGDRENRIDQERF